MIAMKVKRDNSSNNNNNETDSFRFLYAFLLKNDITPQVTKLRLIGRQWL
jgi:hypothetical protein